VAGLMISFPFVANQLWRFVAPGLYKKEKAAFLPFLIASPMMFFAGATFAHLVVTPLAMKFFLGFADTASIFTAFFEQVPGEGVTATVAPEGKKGIDIVFQGKVNETLDITLKLIVAFGLSFQLPVLLTLMGRAGLATSAGLAGVRKYAVVGILALAAVVTPPDVITQLILFVVVYGLYEISIQLVRRFEKKREEELKAEGLWFEDDDEPEATEGGEGTEGGETPEAAEDDPIFKEFDDEEAADAAEHDGEDGTPEEGDEPGTDEPKKGS